MPSSWGGIRSFTSGLSPCPRLPMGLSHRDRESSEMAASLSCRLLVAGVLIARAPLFGDYPGAPDFWKLPNGANSQPVGTGSPRTFPWEPGRGLLPSSKRSSTVPRVVGAWYWCLIGFFRIPNGAQY